MHEWLITRGNVQGAPFEWRMQIYVPWNCVLVHEGECHRGAQWGHEGMIVCLKDVLKYYSADIISKWLRDIEMHLTIASEKLRWMEQYGH
jgi:hypothetical protein